MSVQHNDKTECSRRNNKLTTRSRSLVCMSAGLTLPSALSDLICFVSFFSCINGNPVSTCLVVSTPFLTIPRAGRASQSTHPFMIMLKIHSSVHSCAWPAPSRKKGNDRMICVQVLQGERCHVHCVLRRVIGVQFLPLAKLRPCSFTHVEVRGLSSFTPVLLINLSTCAAPASIVAHSPGLHLAIHSTIRTCLAIFSPSPTMVVLMQYSALDTCSCPFKCSGNQTKQSRRHATRPRCHEKDGGIGMEMFGLPQSRASGVLPCTRCPSSPLFWSLTRLSRLATHLSLAPRSSSRNFTHMSKSHGACHVCPTHVVDHQRLLLAARRS